MPVAKNSSAGRSRPRSEHKRIEILRAAAGIFRRRGYHGTSVDQIADALNMAPGNLYYYFRNKEEILYVCHDYSLGLILKELEDVEASDLPPDQQIHRLIVSFVHLFIDVLHGTAWTLEVEALSPALLKRIVARRDRIDKGFRTIIAAGMRSGIFAERDPKLASFVIFGAINWIPRWYDPSGRATSGEIAQVFADYLVAGLQDGGSASDGSWLRRDPPHEDAVAKPRSKPRRDLPHRGAVAKSRVRVRP